MTVDRESFYLDRCAYEADERPTWTEDCRAVCVRCDLPMALDQDGDVWWCECGMTAEADGWREGE